MTSAELRKAFLDFFVKQGHTAVHSSPVVPANDPTLLFTNAGMVQFKETFLGQEKRDYVRATSVQRCIRAGGKHNDLENVGYTARHHTFFEMLGNFSFGDYFKHEAIQYAWTFLTEELKLPAEKLWITVFEEDQEAEDIWLNEIGVSADRFSRCGAKDNFWSMGDTGPCGPCSEIFYDHGAEVAGGPPGSPEEDGDRYIEIWNLVFMQFDRSEDGTLTPLPKPSVDTGMGLERLAAVMQHQHNNYDIDLFQAIVKKAAELTGETDLTNNSLRVIADHIRSCAFMIVDGVLPANEGRGYVLRRIIRRAIRHGYKLGQTGLFFNQLVEVLVQQMGDAYPELVQQQANVERVLTLEEKRFAETLENGMRILEEAFAQLTGTVVSGAVAFKLYDTYGFPFDLTADVARERNLTVDEVGFAKEMEAQRARARSASQFATQGSLKVDFDSPTLFVGYDKDTEAAEIQAIFVKGESVESVSEGTEAIIVLNQTPFYAESGGQVGDQGSLTEGMNSFHVDNCQKQGATFLHIGKVTAGTLVVNQTIQAHIDVKARRASERNHSATHLLHAALRSILGTHVGQKGSLVEPERLRFDFSHFEPISAETCLEIEQLVNRQIMKNATVKMAEMDIEAAKSKGAMALFGEKYGDVVRVVELGEFSIELCGGTHVNSTGDIGPFRILSESGIASGVRRIEAVTGEAAWEAIYDSEQRLLEVASQLKTDKSQVVTKLTQWVAESKDIEKQLKKLQSKLASSQGDDLTRSAVEINGVKVLAAQIEGADVNTLRETLDKLKDKLAPAAIVLAAVDGDKVTLVAGVSKSITDKIKAGQLVNHVAQQVGGKGGGRPDMAQAGGKEPEKLPQALASVPAWVETLG
ncbi:MAG: alanine--tRNA ligase [Piscirickettsiaceae bacterium CG_4_9_14_3_um_filter_43_564]|nr:alanine--tRNA ligase [Thiomicrospira sp.]OIP93773.1 MAG: alanine--tRNA ligase [Thiomicrospira sp. CG2_30_44_34]PIQ06393.1 MAG: alanine--tRNA ligase [Piscirickettsiaceae bacterium CG18_big_fil_WC_8_21_14_2_50_44_103]PIU37864.1 MAG: alanine--tRNA ligase [Piscirickettsiaceae bacterium CG07_land_8_20_14_0_80_44_28]PIW57236.1 MAG: alanine--tRNA ligase [Piscirickettsiaceae bacterium CG12_big_fil_rev_8_21_14_0_65_44_934]PIW77912.1 MAG: alanine--tRNA ligase [Piscirickettsiaceae bacterium CG_4_8_14_